MEIEDNISEDEYDIIQENSSSSDSEENEKDNQINNKKRLPSPYIKIENKNY